MADMYSWLSFDLQRFADGGSGDGGGGSGTAATGANTQGAAAPATTGEEPVLRTKRGTPIYAKQAAPAAQPKQEEAAPAQAVAEQKEPDETYETVVRGKYKAQYDADVQSIVQNRLKNMKPLADTVDRMQPLLQVLADRYKIDLSDPTKVDYAALAETVLADPKYIEAQSLETGKPEEDLKELAVLKFRAAQQQAQTQRQAQEATQRQRYAAIAQEAEAAKGKYPGLNIQTEMANPEFRRMVENGIPVQRAYESLHMDEILAGAMQFTAQKVSQQVSNAIQSGSTRPAESAAKPQQASITAADIKSKAFRDQIKERVRRGERVVL